MQTILKGADAEKGALCLFLRVVNHFVIIFRYNKMVIEEKRFRHA